MILFDANMIHGTDVYNGGQNYANYSEGSPGGGASLRQSVIGLEVQVRIYLVTGRYTGLYLWTSPPAAKRTMYSELEMPTFLSIGRSAD